MSRLFSLHHGQARVDRFGTPDDVYAPLVLQSPGVYTFALGGVAALELVEVTPGTFSAVAVGTSPNSPRLRAISRGQNKYVGRG